MEKPLVVARLALGVITGVFCCTTSHPNPPPNTHSVATITGASSTRKIAFADVSPAEGVGFILGPHGELGAALISKAYDAKADLEWVPKSPVVGDEWTTIATPTGVFDIEKALKIDPKESIALLSFSLRLPQKKQLTMLLTIDDGVEVAIDHHVVYSRDEPRPPRPDDDIIPLSLDAGDHTIVLKLHQREGAWTAAVRIVGDNLLPVPEMRVVLPKASEQDKSAIAATVASARFHRQLAPSGYELSFDAAFDAGMPMHASWPIAIKSQEGSREVLSRSALGALDSQGVPKYVQSFVVPHWASLNALEGHDFKLTASIGEQSITSDFRPRKEVRAALQRAQNFIANHQGKPGPAPDTLAAITYNLERLEHQFESGDINTSAQIFDSSQLNQIIDDAENGRDSLTTRTGVFRWAHVARADNLPQPFAIYVPAGANNANNKGKMPLYVGLHGMWSGPMAMMRVFFGGDEEHISHYELDRWMTPFEPISAFVIAPHAHGNAMYRQLGEQEVMDMIAWAKGRFPAIDASRIYVTGFSMGGIGAAAIPLHHPDVFAAAEPLCGYHSYWIRRDIAGRNYRPWEASLIEERSNVSWVDNGSRLPMWIIHGTRDLPEQNSGVLIDAYRRHHFILQDDHPDKGHDVWGWAYEDQKQLKWFGNYRANLHPRSITFATDRTRFGRDAWISVDVLEHPGVFGHLKAKAQKGRVELATDGVSELHLDRDDTFDDASVKVSINGSEITFAHDEPISVHRDNATWIKGPIESSPIKRGRVTGPFRDAWNEPLVFVYGASDDAQTEANRLVARAFASIREGVDVHYPIVSDAEFSADQYGSQSLVLVGNSKSNRVLRALESKLPILIAPKTETDAGYVKLGERVFTGSQLGAAFVYPMPADPNRYVVVIAGVDALGTLRSLSLPDLVPDFMVWDESLAKSRGQILLSFGAARAGGFFDLHWQLPADTDDPFADTVRAPKNQREATSYLP